MGETIEGPRIAVPKLTLFKVQEAAHALQKSRMARLSNRARNFPVRSNRATLVGHPCEAKLFFERTEWQRKKTPDADLQAIFDEGNRHEAAMLQDLQTDCSELGFRLVAQQQDFMDKGLNIVGHIDCMIGTPRDDAPIEKWLWIPTELKSLNPYTYGELNTAADFRDHPRAWIAGYYGQLQTYLYLSNLEVGQFYLKDKSSGATKFVPVAIDWDFCQAMVKRVENVNLHLGAGNGEVPSRILQRKYCEDCPFNEHCLDAEMQKQIALPEYNAQELLDALDGIEAYAESAKSVDTLKKIAREHVWAAPHDAFICGRWEIERKVAKDGSRRYKAKLKGAQESAAAA